MQTVENLITKLKELPQVVKTTIEDSFNANREDVADMNRNQLLSGFDSLGRELGQYAPLSVVIRQKRGLQADYIDLRFTGQSQDSIELREKGNLEYDLTAGVINWDQSQWPDAIGLDEQSETDVTGMITKDLDFHIDKYL